jgi:Transposase IS116/IS110/IS902 family
LRREARHDLILECRKHSETKLLRTVPWLGPIRVALLIGRVQTPHRFRSKRQFWAYCGLALETRSSADYQMVNGQLERRKKPAFIRGLNLNHNHDLKNLFKSAATTASHGPFRPFYENLLGRGLAITQELGYTYFSQMFQGFLKNLDVRKAMIQFKQQGDVTVTELAQIREAMNKRNEAMQ